MSYPDSIDIIADNKDVESAVLAAKYGKWDRVFEILDKKPYLLNCIPESRSWGILHQAVYWKDQDALQKILKYKNCDATIRTKPCSEGDALPSSTPIEVAKQLHGRETLKKILEEHIEEKKHEKFGKEIKYMVPGKDGEKVVDKLPLFMMAVVNYKRSLIGQKSCPKTHLMELLKQVFTAESHNWQIVQKQLYRAMYSIDRRASEDFESAISDNHLFKKIVHFYTRPQYHSLINNAISRNFVKKVPATAKDMGLALYDLMLDCVLMCWPKLTGVDYITWRGVRRDTNQYNKGDVIMFTHFLSSSKLESKGKQFAEIKKGYPAENKTLFKINNSAKSRYRPKDIFTDPDMTMFPGEQECLYGIGAEFRVTDVTNETKNNEKYRLVKLSLI